MHLAEPLEITQIVADILETLQIPYFIGGSLASSLYGFPRATQDVDIIADIKTQQVQSFLEALQNKFYASHEMITEAIQNCSSFNIIHLATMFKVDVFVMKNDQGSQEEMVRKEKYQISEHPAKTLYIASAEDIILHKLRWLKLGGGVSERQWNDAIGVLQVQKTNLSYDYLRRRAVEMGVAELLKNAFSETEIGG